MREARTLQLAVACMAAALFAWVLPAGGQEPSYDGLSLRQWLEILGDWRMNGTTNYYNARAAVRQIGTNAIPFLLEWIAYDPTIPGDWPRNAGPYGDPRRYALARDAEYAFRVLGASAAPALPSLSNLVALSQQPGGASRAIEAMSDIGPAALPQLIAILTNGAPPNRRSAAGTVARLGTNASPAVPALILCLTNSVTREPALKSLAYLRLEPQLVVPALGNLARDPDPAARCGAIRALSMFSHEARIALPQILAALDDPDKYVRADATNTLHQIAPEALPPSAH